MNSYGFKLYLSEAYRWDPPSLIEESLLYGNVYAEDWTSQQLNNKSSVFLAELLISQLNFLKLIITAVLAFCSKHIWSYYVKRKFGFLEDISKLVDYIFITRHRWAGVYANT